MTKSTDIEIEILKHGRDCPAVKAYWRLTGALVVLAAIFTGIVWMAKGSLENEIGKVVSRELDRRFPASASSSRQVRAETTHQRLITVLPSAMARQP